MARRWGGGWSLGAVDGGRVGARCERFNRSARTTLRTPPPHPGRTPASSSGATAKGDRAGGIPSPDQFRHRGVSRETHPLFAVCTSVATTRHPDAPRAPGAVFHVKHNSVTMDAHARPLRTAAATIVTTHRIPPQPPVPGPDQRDASSCDLTRFAIGKHAVKPGDSIPNRFTSPATPCTPGPSIRKSAAASPGPTNLGRIPA